MADDADGERTQLDIPGIHARFGTARELIARPRALYGLAARALSDGNVGSLPAGVLDKSDEPISYRTRAGGGPTVNLTALTPIADLTTRVRPARGRAVSLVSHPNADQALAPVMTSVTRAIGRSEQATPRLLTTADVAGFEAAPQSAPGLLLSEYPTSELDLAEALIHEAAHAKLFELAITGAVFTPTPTISLRFIRPGIPRRRAGG